MDVEIPEELFVSFDDLAREIGFEEVGSLIALAVKRGHPAVDETQHGVRPSASGTGNGHSHPTTVDVPKSLLGELGVADDPPEAVTNAVVASLCAYMEASPHMTAPETESSGTAESDEDHVKDRLSDLGYIG